MKKLVLLLFQTVALSSCLFAQTRHNINAIVNGTGNDTVYVMYTALSDTRKIQTDTLLAHQNHFTYTLPINEPAEIAIIPERSFHKFPSGRVYVPNTQFINLIIRPTDEITITGNLSEDYLDYKVKGSVLNETIDSIRKTYESLDTEAVNYELQSGLLPDSKENRELSKTLFNKRMAATQKISQIRLNYIAQNPDNEASAFFLLRQSLETFAAYYPKLSGNIRNGIFSQALEIQYAQYQKFMKTNAASQTIKDGSAAPDFSLNDINGKPFSLSQIKGQYIVLDFWGTWCGWCVKEFPKMKKYYDKYKSHVEFIGIACNNSEPELKKAVKQYQLDWKQLLNSPTNDVSILYGVKAYPTKIIMDQNLRIIKIFNGYDNAFFEELDKLMK